MTTFGAGGVLVVLGLALVVISLILECLTPARHQASSLLLRVGVLLIGVGVLCGKTVLVSSS